MCKNCPSCSHGIIINSIVDREHNIVGELINFIIKFVGVGDGNGVSYSSGGKPND
ncbi:uncharacterized protein ACLA_099030 [Aspergillus clavatus NRRL 1]|uniref:Uncharacterized protein n=1 Tax=Aspergillus clavatus (strain ATCC 1007 / CBS 513.65 / DSM 816 / NCTC 3887 / NRRL 1 / QM 1276 / 107) TaxID=344612 RepID=A1CN22_ASPCL|nr:uncharacterized protein ACLA_099030 [Aspergillus clavatus NRRL 1]EAW08959.1 hypothetical protein ACLA_099030 [Aspergillus clavatus NRRL 1]